MVILNLGTNDASTHGDPGPPFVDAYVAFVEHVRGKYPAAWILCVDANAIVTQDISDAVATLKGHGDTRVESVALTGQNVRGCDGHPDAASDAEMGQNLAAEIARVMGW